MDLSQYNVRQLKELIKNYNLHYHIRDYYKKTRPQLEEIIKDYMEYVNDKIYNKKRVDIKEPKPAIKKVRTPRAKMEIEKKQDFKPIPEIKKPEPKQEPEIKLKKQDYESNNDESSKNINEFDKLTDAEKYKYLKNLSDNILPVIGYKNLKFYEHMYKYTSQKFYEYYEKLSFGLDDLNVDFDTQYSYVNTILPYLKDFPEVIESNKVRGNAKKMKILEPLKKRLGENYDKVIEPFKKWLVNKNKLVLILRKLKKYKE